MSKKRKFISYENKRLNQKLIGKNNIDFSEKVEQSPQVINLMLKIFN